MGTGMPYTRTIMQVLAVNIFHKLLSFKLYDENGQRKSPNVEICEEIMHAVQYPMLANRYLAKNNENTEWHKSCSELRNVYLGTTVPT